MKKENTDNLSYKPIIIGVAVSAIATLCLIFIMAIIMSLTDIDAKFSSLLSSIALTIGSFFGGFAASKINKKNGMLIGIISSAILFILITIISVIVDSGGLSLLTLIHAVLMLLAGAIGGIVGVNGKEKTKI